MLDNRLILRIQVDLLASHVAHNVALLVILRSRDARDAVVDRGVVVIIDVLLVALLIDGAAPELALILIDR